jgi:hypothetical protein
MLSGSSPIFVLSNHTTCSQTQTGATVPLNKVKHHFWFSTDDGFEKDCFEDDCKLEISWFESALSYLYEHIWRERYCTMIAFRETPQLIHVGVL